MRSTRSLSWISGLLGLEPAPVPPHVFGVDAASVRYGCFPQGAVGLAAREHHEVALPPETFGAGLVGCALQEERSFRQGLDDLLSRIAGPVTEASVVLPDSWLRLAFTETGALPRGARERDEVVRWKLKQLVPFRVDDLRIRALEVDRLAGSEEPVRLMVGFGLELLIGQIEAAFSAYGIRVGWVSNVSLSLVEAVWKGVGRDEPVAVFSVDRDGYAMAFAEPGGVVLHRFKGLEGGADDRRAGVLRELRLTRSYLEDRLAGVGPVFLFAPPGEASQWEGWIRDGLGTDEVRQGIAFLRWEGRPDDLELWRLAPLMGAACRMIG